MNDKTTIAEFEEEVYEVACDKGWWGEPEERKLLLSADSVLAKNMLVVTELAEAVELVREKDFDPKLTFYVGTGGTVTETLGAKIPYDEWKKRRGYHASVEIDGQEEANKLQPKPEGFGIELADAVIRIGDLAARMGIDLSAAIVLKHEYNKTRPHRHGNKRA